MRRSDRRPRRRPHLRVRRLPQARLAGVLALALSAVLVVGAGADHAAAADRPAVEAPRGGLGESLDAILADPRLAGAQAGVVVRTAGSGELLYAHRGDRRMVPASNQKLLTSAAALEVLGPDYRFTTEVLTGGALRGGELHGDLYLRGTGDPTIRAGGYARLAAAVAARGITVVRGRLVADDTWFDGVRLGRDWAWDDEQYGYAAPVSALTVAPGASAEPGSVRVEVRPGTAPGRPARVTTVPAAGADVIVNDAVTGTPGSARSVTVRRGHGSRRIVVSGSIPAGAPAYRVERSVWDPTGLAARVFADALAANGVHVVGGVTRGVTPEAARTLAGVRSRPLGELVVPLLKLSRNGYAEALVKAMGRAAHKEGSADAGLDAVTAGLAAIGMDTAGLRAADGSGLSRQNLVSPAHLADLLVEAEDEPWFRAWYTALPVAAAPERLVGGTLRSRMRGTPAAGRVHAKTGTLTGVSALSGYVTGAGGRRLVFSVLLNNYLGAAPKDLEDRIAVAVARTAAAGTGTGTSTGTTADVASEVVPAREPQAA